MGSWTSKEVPCKEFNFYLGITFHEMVMKIHQKYPKARITTIAMKEGDVYVPIKGSKHHFIVTYNALTWSVIGVYVG
jgi:hypothetical protein